MTTKKIPSILLSFVIFLLSLTVGNLALASTISPQAFKTTLTRTLVSTHDEGTWGGKGSNEYWNHSWTMVDDGAVQLNNIKQVDDEFTADLKIAWRCRHTRQHYNYFDIRTSKSDNRYSGYVTAEVSVGTIAGQSRIYLKKINNTYRNLRCGDSVVNKLKKLDGAEL